MTGIYATFTGIDSIESANFTLSHGASPSSGVIVMFPQAATPPQTGTLRLGNDGEEVSFFDCLIDDPTMKADSGGMKITLKVYDRRWRWKFKSITGKYNTRSKADSTKIQPNCEKTPQELATLLFQALGESNFDVSALPNFTRPEVEWFEDNPAEELEELVEDLGCRIVPKMGDRFAIEPLGQGAGIPGDFLMSRSQGFNPEPIPEKLRMVTGPVVFQQRFELEAVGKDTDGKIKLINNLSYKPAAGWEKESPYAILPSVTDEKIRELAEETVFRWYRIREEITVVGNSKTTSRRDILPVRGNLVDEEADDEGVMVPKKAVVDGKFYDDHALSAIDSTKFIEVKDGWTLDEKRGIVQFQNFKVLIDDTTGETTPAEMRLLCSFTCRETESQSEVKYIYNRPLSRGVPNTGALIQKKDELTPTVKEQYNTSGSVIQPPVNNLQKLDSEINYYLDAMEAGLNPSAVDDGEYPGIRGIEPNGAILQVGWEVVSGQGAKTRASYNTEHDVTVPTYKEAKAARIRQQSGMITSRAMRRIQLEQRGGLT